MSSGNGVNLVGNGVNLVPLLWDISSRVLHSCYSCELLLTPAWSLQHQSKRLLREMVLSASEGKVLSNGKISLCLQGCANEL